MLCCASSKAGRRYDPSICRCKKKKSKTADWIRYPLVLMGCIILRPKGCFNTGHDACGWLPIHENRWDMVGMQPIELPQGWSFQPHGGFQEKWIHWWIHWVITAGWPMPAKPLHPLKPMGLTPPCKEIGLGWNRLMVISALTKQKMQHKFFSVVLIVLHVGY